MRQLAGSAVLDISSKHERNGLLKIVCLTKVVPTQRPTVLNPQLVLAHDDPVAAIVCL